MTWPRWPYQPKLKLSSLHPILKYLCSNNHRGAQLNNLTQNSIPRKFNLPKSLKNMQQKKTKPKEEHKNFFCKIEEDLGRKVTDLKLCTSNDFP